MQGFDVPEVREGDLILPAWEELQRAETAARVQLGRNVRRRQTPAGIALTVDNRAALWPHPFKCSLVGKEVQVSAGLVGEIMPTISGRKIDGTDAGGEDTGSIPRVKITGSPDEGLRSWICIEVTVLEDTGGIDLENPEPVIITHRTSLAADSEFTGIHPLAQIKWSDVRSPSQIFQVVHHNLQHRFYPATATRGARHTFWPA